MPSALAEARSPTPCLDKQIPLPPRKAIDAELRWWQLATLGALLLVKTIFVIYAVEMGCILVHEAGHVLGGALGGLRFNYLRIGPLKVERSGRISWLWTWYGLTSGATSSLPTSQRALRWRLCLFAVAGPATSLGSAFLVWKVMPRDNSLTAAVGLCFVALSTLIGFGNLLPLRRQGRMLDGLQIWIYLFSRSRREGLIFLETFVADAKRGKTTNFLDDPALERVSLISDNSNQQVVTNWLAYAKSMGSRNCTSAAQHLEVCLLASGAVSKDLREELVIEAAQFQVLRRNRPDLAREWLSLERSGRPRARRFYAEALVLYRENQLEQALAKTEQGVALLEGISNNDPAGRALVRLRDALRGSKSGEGEVNLETFETLKP